MRFTEIDENLLNQQMALDDKTSTGKVSFCAKHSVVISKTEDVDKPLSFNIASMAKNKAEQKTSISRFQPGISLNASFTTLKELVWFALLFLLSLLKCHVLICGQ